jgi:signal transduction histidine kinase
VEDPAQITKSVGRGFDLLSLSERLYARGGLHRGLRVAIVFLLLAASTLFVVATGGTFTPYVHVFYVPIILSNFLLGGLPGIITALLSGIIAGLIPLNINEGLAQNPMMILFRAFFFMLVSLLAGINAAMTQGFIDHLQVKVLEKTAELQKSYQELLDLQDEKEFLTNTMVHDLKSSLASNLLSCTTLNKRYRHFLDEAGRGLLENSIASGNRMLNMISNILDVYAREKEALTIRLVEWEPIPCLEELAEAFRIQTSLKNVTLRLDYDPDLPAVKGDCELIRRTMENLLFNAVKHTPPGGVITLESRKREGHLEISVHNTGSVIPDEWKEKIFEPFTIAHGDDRRKSGSGLGLAFCRMAVDGHGGKIWAESGPHSGTRFCFTLPL